MTHLYGFERVTHHGDEHIREDDDNGNVVESKQEVTDAFDDGGRVVSTRETIGELVVQLLRRVLDLHALHADQSEHRPEETEQRPRHTTSPA